MKKTLPKLVACLCLLFISISLYAQILPFQNCPGVSVAVTRPGFNATLGPLQVYTIDAQGKIQASGNPIDLQINGFGLNTVDGFLYGMYQAYNIINPFLTRVGRNGNYENVGTLKGPDVGSLKASVVNTAAGTMDDQDNYYFTAVVVDLQNILLPPDLYVGKVQKVSTLAKSDNVLPVTYTKINPGTCADELLAAIANPQEGALQDIAWNPVNGNIYTYIPAPGTNPTPGKMAWFNPNVANPVFTCMDTPQPNTPTNDLSGLYFGMDSMLYILTIDGKYYKGNVQTGAISLVTQTTLPLLNGNLRGDMASCIGAMPTARQDQPDNPARIAPNPVSGNQVLVEVQADENVRVQVKIMDARGTYVKATAMDLAPGLNQFRLDLSGLRQGLYTAILTYPSGKRTVIKFIKM